MKDLLVVMPCTQEYGSMQEYVRQLVAAEIHAHIEKLASIPNGNAGGTHAYAIDLMRRNCQRFSDYQKIVFSDAFDVLFYGTKAEAIRKIPEDRVMLAAERNCYPEKLEIGGDTAWRYVNCGLSAGTPANFLTWLDEQEKHPFYHPIGLNQGFFNRLLQEGSPLARIDSRTELFYCLFGETNELHFENGLPVNTVLGTHPNFVHANGKWAMKRP